MSAKFFFLLILLMVYITSGGKNRGGKKIDVPWYMSGRARTGWALKGPFVLPDKKMVISNYSITFIYDCVVTNAPIVISEMVVNILKESKSMIVHLRHPIFLYRIEVKLAEAPDEDYVEVKHYDYNTNTDMMRIVPGEVLEKDKTYIFKFEIRNYLRTYTDKSNEVIVATTNPGNFKAHTAFASWDSPLYTATFNLSIVFPSEYTTMAITRKTHTSHVRTLKDRVWTKYFKNCTNLVEDHFEKTPVIAAELVSFIVFKDFSCKKAVVETEVGMELTVCSRKVLGDASKELALKYGKKILSALHELTGHQENIVEKVDHIAVPFEVLPEGTMGSFGLKILKESDLLYDPKHSSNFQKQKVIIAIAQAFADIWFKNRQISQDLSQNEGLPKYLAYLIPEKIDPSLELERQFAVDYLQPSLQHYICNYSLNVLKEDESIGWFLKLDKKSPCLFQMIHYMLGYTRFQQMIQNYVLAQSAPYFTIYGHLYFILKNTTLAEEFFFHFLENWKDGRGHPIVKVSSIENMQVNISQIERFWDCKHAPHEKHVTKWSIPITYTKSSDYRKFQQLDPFYLGLPLAEVKTLTILEGNEWIILNNQQKGFYRVLYDQKLLQAIIKALNTTGFDGIHEINRAQIIDDYFFFTYKKMRSFVTFFRICDFLKFDTSYYPWKSALRAFTKIYNNFYHEKELIEKFMKYVRDMMKGIYNSVSFHEDKDYDHMYSIKRDVVMSNACFYGIEHCINHSKKAFEDYEKTKIKPDKNLRSTIYCYGLRHSSDVYGSFLFLLEEYNKTESDEERDKIVASLPCVKDPELLYSYLEMLILDKNDIYKLGDPVARFTEVCENSPEAMETARDFIIANVDSNQRKYKDSLLDFARILNMKFSSEEHKFNITDLFPRNTTEYLHMLESERILDETISHNKELLMDLKVVFNISTKRPITN